MVVCRSVVVVVCLHVVGYVSHKTMNVLCGEGLFK